MRHASPYHLSPRDLETWAALEKDYIHIHNLPDWALRIMWRTFLEVYGTQQRSIYKGLTNV